LSAKFPVGRCALKRSVANLASFAIPSKEEPDAALTMPKLVEARRAQSKALLVVVTMSVIPAMNATT